MFIIKATLVNYNKFGLPQGDTMLNEILAKQQSTLNTKKRWFSCQDMDLFIWFDKGTPIRFLLSYDKQTTEHAIRWTQDIGFQHFQVDDGESTPGRYKQSPLLLRLRNEFDAFSVARHFLANSYQMDTHISDFIYAHLIEYLDIIAPRCDTRPIENTLRMKHA